MDHPYGPPPPPPPGAGEYRGLVFLPLSLILYYKKEMIYELNIKTIY